MSELTFRTVAEDMVDRSADTWEDIQDLFGYPIEREHGVQLVETYLRRSIKDPVQMSMADVLNHYRDEYVTDFDLQEFLVNPSAGKAKMRELIDSIPDDHDDPLINEKIRRVTVISTRWLEELGKMWMAQASGDLGDEVEEGVSAKVTFVPLGVRVRGTRPNPNGIPILDAHEEDA